MSHVDSKKLPCRPVEFKGTDSIVLSCVSEWVMVFFNGEPTARLVFTVKTSLDVFSLRWEHLWTCSVLRDCICEMKRVAVSGQQGIKTWDHFCHTLILGEPSTNRESNPKDHLLSAGSPLSSSSTISRGYWGPILPKGQKPLPWPPRDVFPVLSLANSSLFSYLYSWCCIRWEHPGPLVSYWCGSWASFHSASSCSGRKHQVSMYIPRTTVMATTNR